MEQIPVEDAQQVRRFGLYMDESGSQKPSPHDPTPFFAMGGILVEQGTEDTIQNLLSGFKERWNIDLSTPLHGTDIRSKKKNFRFLENFSAEKLSEFHTDLNTTVTSCPITIHACVVSRAGYLERFEPTYGSDTWEMMRSSFAILIERAAKHVRTQNGRMMVYFEEIGSREDKQIKSYFKEIRSNGMPFNQTTSSKYSPCVVADLSGVLAGIEGKSKKNPLIQLADLCLHPVADVKRHPSNRAYTAFKDGGIIIDCHLQAEQLPEMGIKYYCY